MLLTSLGNHQAYRQMCIIARVVYSDLQHASSSYMIIRG